jgi:hypothetical protein
MKWPRESALQCLLFLDIMIVLGSPEVGWTFYSLLKSFINTAVSAGSFAWAGGLPSGFQKYSGDSGWAVESRVSGFSQPR